MQHLPAETPVLLDAAERTGADLVLGERRFRREDMPASRYHANRIGSRVSWFVGAPVEDTQCGFRVFKVEALRRLPLRARGYEIETEMLVKVRRRGGRRDRVPVTAVYGGAAASCVRSAIRPAPVSWRCTISSLNRSDLRRKGPLAPFNRGTAAVDAARAEQRRYLQRDRAGVRACRAPCPTRSATSAPGSRGALMPQRAPRRRRQPARAVFPAEPERALSGGALRRCGPTRATAIDFLRARVAGRRERAALFVASQTAVAILRPICAAAGRGAILVTGHYGNWEVGSSPDHAARPAAVHHRRDGRGEPRGQPARARFATQLGVDTIEVRQSLDTALQIGAPGGEPDGRDADGPPPRTRSRAGDAARTRPASGSCARPR